MTLKYACALVVLGLAACSKAPAPAPVTDAAQAQAAPAQVAASSTPAAVHADDGIAWHKGDVDAAFAMARTQNKPVFLYWGALWCPPCNQVKATIFSRQDFIERSRFFVPVYLDGDKPSAQRQGARFKVSGYPTMILFKPDGGEITRLPGEVDADQYMRVLAMAMNGARPVRETLAAALAAGSGGAKAKLTPEDWRMLAYYSWITDDEELVAKKGVAAALSRLAQACPADQQETATRLKLYALASAATAKGAKPRNDAAATSFLMSVLADPKRARENFDLLVYYAGDIAGFVTLQGTKTRAQLGAAWDAALIALAEDGALSTADRLATVDARVRVARLDSGKSAPVPESLLANVRAQVARADRETTDVYARQSVISATAELLTNAGLIDESDVLLTAELKRSHSPYYFMLGLAENAKKRNDNAAAIGWREKAYAAAEGPATRLQWGVGYVNALIEMAAADGPRIENAATQVIGELEPVPDTFYDRNRRALERLGKKLGEWNKGRQHDASLQRIRARMAGVCARLPAKDPARAACDGLLRPAKTNAT